MQTTARTAAQIGAIIRRARRARHLSQMGLGEKIGLRQATISKVEKGEPATQLSTLLDVLTALNLELVITERKQASREHLEDLF